MDAKRPRSLPPSSDLSLAKRPRGGDASSSALTTTDGVARTSSLAAPTLQLTGHAGEVFAAPFAPDGALLASGGHDKQVLLWRAGGDCECVGSLTGAKNAVLALAWCGADRVVAASADKSARAFDVEAETQVKRMAEGGAIVNAVAASGVGAPIVVVVGDDGVGRVYDMRRRRSVACLGGAPKLPLLAAALAQDGATAFLGGIDNTVRSWDLRRPDAPSLTLTGHADSITGLALHPAGTHILSNGADGALREWDVRPFAPADRCARVFVGARHGPDKALHRCAYSADGGRVAAGGADGAVTVWSGKTGAPEYVLPGHSGSVNDVAFHPLETAVIVSASSDGTLFVGELADG